MAKKLDPNHTRRSRESRRARAVEDLLAPRVVSVVMRPSAAMVKEAAAALKQLRGLRLMLFRERRRRFKFGCSILVPFGSTLFQKRATSIFKFGCSTCGSTSFQTWYQPTADTALLFAEG